MPLEVGAYSLSQAAD